MVHWKQVAESVPSSNQAIVCCLPFAVVCTASTPAPPQHLGSANIGPLRRWPTAAARLGNHKSPNSLGRTPLLLLPFSSLHSSPVKLDNYLATLAVVRAVVVCYFRRNSSSPSTSSPQRICTIGTLNKFNCCSSKSHHNLSIAMATQHTAVEVCNPPFLPQHHRNKLSRRPPTYHSPQIPFRFHFGTKKIVLL